MRDILPWLTSSPIPNDSLYQFFIFSINWWLQFTLYGLAYYLVFRTIKTERRLRETEVANLLLEKKALVTEMEKTEIHRQKLQAEYNQLKAQINPHFLFNTLSLIYNEVTPHSRRATLAVEALSDMMRYSLHQPAAADGLAALDDEVAHIDNYLLLLQMRYGGGLHIQYTKEGNLAGWRLPPHLLITLVENACKHGELNNAAHPLQITLQAGPQQLQFEVYNKTGGVKNPGSGIGLPYIQQRLQAQYGAGHSFTYAENNGFFTARLHIAANGSTLTPLPLPQFAKP